MENTANNKYFNGEHNHCTDFSRILAELTIPIIIERAPTYSTVQSRKETHSTLHRNTKDSKA